MEDSQFSITLPSKSSRIDFPQNTPGQYKVSLPETVKLRGKWKVCLLTMTYPLTFKNVPEGRNSFTVNCNGQKRTLTIPAGYYSSIEKVVNTMNLVLYDVEIQQRQQTDSSKKRGRTGGRTTTKRLYPDLMEFKYDAYGGIVTLIIRYTASVVEETSVQFDEPSVLGGMLGFPSDTKLWTGDAIASSKSGTELIIAGKKHTIDTIKQLYVYSNICAHSIVGGHRAPILREFKASSGEYGEIIEREFSRLQYKPVAVSEFPMIEIVVGDNAGNVVDFERGEVTLTLDFKREL